VLLAVATRAGVINTRDVVRNAPWQIVIFSLGMYLVVYGLRNAGLTNQLSGVLNHFAEHGVWGAALGTGLLSAFLSSIMNNMPTVLIGALSIDAAVANNAVREAMIYANVIGCDLGRKSRLSAASPHCCGYTCWQTKISRFPGAIISGWVSF
jgi:arsenical pump membrane protein